MLLYIATLLLVLFTLTSNAYAVIYYISPTGNNTSAGTSTTTPWLTFSFSLPRLFPGDTLTLLDGTYTIGTTGLMDIACPSPHRNGTAGAPITIKAQNERQAHLSSNGTRGTLHMNGCSYWVVEGLRMTTTDNATISSGSGDNVVVWNGAHHLTFRRNLVQFNNRRGNSHTMLFESVHNSLIEENEIYSSHRHGILLYGTNPANTPSFNTLRRNYINSRNRVDCTSGSPCAGGAGYVSDPTNRGDAGISCYPCNNSIIENNITENWGAGSDIQAKGNARDNRFLGHISLDNSYGGLIFTGRNDWGVSIESMPRLNQVTNYLGYSNAVGWWTRGGKDNTCTNCTLLSNTQGVISDFEAHAPGDGSRSIFGSNMLLSGNSTFSFNIATGTALFNENDVFNNPSGASPAIPNAFYTNVITSDPALGTCRVYIPVGSPAKGTGVGGADIGANILFRYQDGILTTSPLWNPTTGVFPCGAIVAGVNDVAGSSCSNVHERLNVNFGGCSLPGAVVDAAENFYTSPTGTGTCLASNSPCTNGAVWGLVGPGDTVNMGPGTYTGDSGMINPPANLHGTSAARITVKATTPGTVIIDGQGARIPLMIDSNNYWTIEDVWVKGSSFSNAIAQYSVEPIFRRVISWDANGTIDANLFVFREATSPLAEDISAWGSGRHCIHFDGSTNAVIRRAFLMRNNTNQIGPCINTTGRATGTILANIIGTVDLDAGANTSVGNTIGPETLIGASGFTTATTKILGSIFYATSAQTPGVQSAVIEMGMLPALIDSGDVVTTITDNILVLCRSCTIPAMSFSQDGVKSIITTDHWTDSPARLPASQTTEGTALGGEGFISTFVNGLLNIGSATQVTNGAWIRFALNVDGTVSATPLWPWSQNEVIKAALIASGRAAQGGIAGGNETDLNAFILSETAESVFTGPLVMVWTIQPISYGEDLILPASEVCVYDSSTVPILQLNYTDPIVISIEDNPSAGTLAGTTSIIPTNGCSRYPTNSINNAGVNYSFKSVSGSLTDVESASFTITPTSSPVVPETRVLQR